MVALLASGFSDDGKKSSDVPDSGPDGSTDTDTDTDDYEDTDCEELGLTVRPFDDTGDPDDGEYDQVVGDLELDTLSGPWSLSQSWTGCDNHVFVLRHSQIWASNVQELITDSPINAHYFFVSMLDEGQEEQVEADVTEMFAKFETFLSSQDQQVQDEWWPRLHFVTTPGRTAGWLGELSQQYNNSIHMIGIDRFQRARDGGYPGRYTGGSWVEQVDHARYLAYYYDYESDLTEQLASESDVHVVNVLDQQDLGDEVLTLDLGTAAELAAYDKLEIDLRADCPEDAGHPVATECGEWDTVGFVRVCADEACEDGGLMVYKWITPYSNEGWWVNDISPMLSYFNHGDPVYIRIHCGYEYKYTVNLRFSDLDDEPVPRVATQLYDNTHVRFDASYNEEFRPTTFTPPAGTTRVVFNGIISGHGMSDSANCAEFCTHQHQLDVNGFAFETEYEMETGDGASFGCARRVSEGVTPNQGGTWVYDRAAWCPGWPVDPWVVDITDAVDLEGENTVLWSSSYQDGYPPGNGGVIDADMYLVFYGADALAATEVVEVPADPACISPLTVTVRDFLTTHPDFALDDLADEAKGIKLGAVEDDLVDISTDEWKPVYAHAGDDTYGMDGPNYVPFTTGESFDQWFTDVDGTNYSTPIDMEWTTSYAGTALFDHWVWYPLDPAFGWGDEGNTENKDYTVEIHSSFTYQGGEILRFSAESDLWVFVNHDLAVDMGGGIHGYTDRVLDLDASAGSLGITLGETYDIHIFAADRNHTPRFTLEMPDNCG
ncbi:MAG: fibro-slime domain-containing protein [Deltaproteobacteria bacterium]|nr:fibro-slime domain-containing protein [Deltaproteobacteria bacterium]